MLSHGYTILEVADTLLFMWMAPTWPATARFFLLALLVGLPILFVFRRPAAEFGARHMHFTFLTPRIIGLGAPALSLAAGLGLWLARPAPPLIQWRLDKEGVTLQSPNGKSSMKWSEVVSIQFDERSPEPEKAAVVLKTKDGREAWFILSWLQQVHREKLLSWINNHAPVRLGAAPSSSK